jgi:UDP-2-acetamido-3-amino-2,3-dideoxy-glucuronate N-acetyltransferase
VAAEEPAAQAGGPAFVHPTAVVDPGAVLGEGVRVWHFVHVCAGADVGAGSVLGQGVYVGPGVRIGAGVKVQNHVSVYAGVTLEDEVFVGPSAVFTNVVRPRAHIDRRHEFAPTRVCRCATIGANATVVCGVTLGEGAFVGAGAVVTRDVAPRVQVTGVPARPSGRRCDCGEALAVAAAGSAGRAGTPVCAACGARYVPRADGGLDRLA